jgi:beta-galactosidase
MRSTLIAMFTLLVVFSRAPAEVSTPFDDGWKFRLGDVPGAQESNYDDSNWQNVELPHDWSIEGAFDPKNASCNAYLPNGIGWYRKTFSVPPSATGKIVTIRFDGIYDNSSVWMNGHLLGERPNGYLPVEYEIEKYLNFGDTANELAVRVDHSAVADARWYTGSGIYRHVFLETANPLRIDPDDMVITTPQISHVEAKMVVGVDVDHDAANHAGTLVYTLLDTDGKEVASTAGPFVLPAQDPGHFSDSLTIPNPHLWSTDDPYLYRLQIDIQVSGQIVDSHSVAVGVRFFHFDPNTGFSLNGQSMKLKGVCVHEDAGALGSAIPIEVWQRRLDLLRQMGANAIRTNHNPPAPEFLDLCDRMGFLVMDEAFDEWTRGKRKWTNGHNQGKFVTSGYSKDFDQWSTIDLSAMIRRDRNHPSIVLWSIGNEIDFRNDPYPPNSPELPPIAARLIRTVRGLDITRPITAACASIASNLYCDQLDVVGYNYQEMRYAQDHAQYPTRIILGSENAQSLPAWLAVQNNAYFAGQFLWTGIDYLGEAPAWPRRSNEAGLLDLAGFPKPRYYYRKSLWSSEPMCYLWPTAHFVVCYTNCDSVELIHDGKSLGVKRLAASHILVWPLVFDSGKLTAIGRDSHEGQSTEVCRFDLAHANPAQALSIDADRTKLSGMGDGRVAQVEIQCVDENGNRDAAAAPEITAEITGPVRILGIENGDASSHESYQASQHHAYRGRMLIYLETTGTVGRAQLGVSSAGLKSASVDFDIQ